MRLVRTIRQPRFDCRWRIWRAYGAIAQSFAARDVAEHICDGEFIWVARRPDGVTWMIDDCPVTLMDTIEHVSPVMVEWVIDQTLAVLGEVLVELTAAELDTPEDAATRILEALEQDGRVGQVAELLMEFVRFSHAARVMAGRFERLRQPLAAEHRDESGEGPGRAAA